jgi:hypothetical protein
VWLVPVLNVSQDAIQISSHFLLTYELPANHTTVIQFNIHIVQALANMKKKGREFD